MKGEHAFCPESGAQLSDQQHWVGGPSGRVPLRAADPESVPGPALEELTNGELVSRTEALIAHFRGHCPDGAPDELVAKAALDLRRLKSQTDAWDCWVWLALAERLDRRGFEVDWMLGCAEPRCPRPQCSSRIQFGASVVGVPAMDCASRCGADSSSDRTGEIHDRIKAVYQLAFGDEAPIEQGEGLNIWERDRLTVLL